MKKAPASATPNNSAAPTNLKNSAAPTSSTNLKNSAAPAKSANPASATSKKTINSFKSEPQTYFTPDEDFEPIIKAALKGKTVTEIKPNNTGWTNIVFEVTTPDGNFFFRFPRDDFWARTIVKDYEFCDFLHGKLDVDTVHLHLLRDKDRPFSMHKKLEGATLADEAPKMNETQVAEVSHDVSKFMAQLHYLDFDKDTLFKEINISPNLPEYLDELLVCHLLPEEMDFWDVAEFGKRPNDCLVHGDLNAKNILLDKNGRVSAVIDFGFAGFGNEYSDIARIIGSCPANFKQPIITSYEEITDTPLDLPLLSSDILTMTNIDSGYIKYMKRIGMI